MRCKECDKTAYASKKLRYTKLAAEPEGGWKTKVCPDEFGFRGFVGKFFSFKHVACKRGVPKPDRHGEKCWYPSIKERAKPKMVTEIT